MGSSPALAANLELMRWSADGNAFEQCSGAGVACAPASCTLAYTSFDTNEFVEGTASMQVNLTGDLQIENGCTQTSGPNLGDPANGEWICYSFAMKIAPDFAWDGDAPIGMKIGRIKRADEMLPGYTTAHLRQNNIAVLGENTACEFDPTCAAMAWSEALLDYDFDPTTNPAVAQWQAYTVGLKRQSAPDVFDAAARLWVDGTMVASQSNFGVCGPTTCVQPMIEAWGSMGTMLFPGFCDNDPNTPCNPVPAGTIWIDDVRLAAGPDECTPYTLGPGGGTSGDGTSGGGTSGGGTSGGGTSGGGTSGGGTSGGGTSGGGASGGGTSESAGTASTSSPTGTAGSGTANADGGGGCSCRSEPTGLSLLGLALFAFAAPRRRRFQ